jgi:tetratricopeptide (TPR) repeat protein
MSQPRSGHHAIEMALRAAFRERFRYCEFYTPADCCRTIPCQRLAEYDAAGCVLFMQKSHDNELADPVFVDNDLVLVQTREPSLRSLSNYELDLRVHNISHTPEYLAFYLAREAHYDVRFYRKWIAPAHPHVHLFYYEDLVRSPTDLFRGLFHRLDLEVTDAKMERILDSLGTHSGDRSASFAARKFETSRYFDKELFGQFAAVLTREVNYLGYTPWTDSGRTEGVVTAIYRAFCARQEGQFAEVIEALDAVGDRQVWAAVSRIRAEALFRTKRRAEGLATLERLAQDHPNYLDGHLALASAYRGAGEMDRYRATISAILENGGDVEKIRRFLADKEDEDLLESLPTLGSATTEPSRGVIREDVIAAFRWILGREPESEQVVASHQSCRSRDALRRAILASKEFRESFERYADVPFAKWPGAATIELLSETDVCEAFLFILGREAEVGAITSHLKLRSRKQLRHALLSSKEFRQKLTT